MSTEITKAKPTGLKQILSSDAMRDQFAAALPKHLTPDRFVRVAITALTRTPKLASCSQESFFKCLLDLSAMGLEPDGRRAHLIPYGKDATLVIDYKGLVELVRRSGDVAKIHADIVCENDHFNHQLGEVKEHTFDLKKDRGEPYAAYAQVTLKDGSVQAEIMSKADIEKIRAKSRAGKSGPWVDHWEEMAKKTAFRRLSKWLTLSPEIQTAISKADEYEFPQMRNATPRAELEVDSNPFEDETEAKAVETPEVEEWD
jgi:recombination protein RecT